MGKIYSSRLSLTPIQSFPSYDLVLKYPHENLPILPGGSSKQSDLNESNIDLMQNDDGNSGVILIDIASQPLINNHRGKENVEEKRTEGIFI